MRRQGQRRAGAGVREKREVPGGGHVVLPTLLGRALDTSLLGAVVGVRLGKDFPAINSIIHLHHVITGNTCGKSHSAVGDELI
jgi:hypothetical protein